ncbi:MAG TPA: ATP-binding protein [Rhodoglobus sp.]|nr:ATP-binding protein [Rhodoglobus sp.]
MAERILIDGRSGSGKSELAAALAPLLRAQLVRLDDLYPGWDGLDEGSAAVPGLLRTGRWRQWDWATDRPGAARTVDLGHPLIVEGVGALTGASRALADAAIWVELDAGTRKARALARDGETYAPHWERWAAQEDVLLRRERPRELADLVVDGSSAEAALRAVLAFLRT